MSNDDCPQWAPIIVAFILASLDDLALSLSGPPLNLLPHRPIEPAWTPSSLLLWDRTKALSPWPMSGVFIAGAVMWWWGRSVRRADGKPSRWMSAAMTSLPYASLALILFVVWESMSLDILDPGAHITPRHTWWLVGVSIVIVLAQSACLSFERGEERTPRPPSSDVMRDQVRA